MSPTRKWKHASLPSCSHISLSPLSIYFSPRLSPSPPSLNPSRSHLQGSHPSFVLLPPPPPPPSPPHVSVCISVCFLSTSAGEKSSPARLILLVFSAALWFGIFIHVPSFFPPPPRSHLSTCGDAALLFLLHFFHLQSFFLSDIPRSILVVHPSSSIIPPLSFLEKRAGKKKRTWEIKRRFRNVKFSRQTLKKVSKVHRILTKENRNSVKLYHNISQHPCFSQTPSPHLQGSRPRSPASRIDRGRPAAAWCRAPCRSCRTPPRSRTSWGRRS